jgi:hypothetical protein
MSRFAGCLVCVVLLAPNARGDRPATTQRAAVPSPEAQADARRLVASVFGEELARTEPGAVRALVDLLIQQGRETHADLAARYVLYDMAIERAVGLGDIDRATQALDLLAANFAIDAPERRAQVVESLLPRVQSPDEARSLAGLALSGFAELLQDRRFLLAERLLTAAESGAKSGRDVPTAVRVAQARALLAEAQRGSRIEAELQRALAAAPDDPAANLAMGQHLCFVTGEWTLGLAHLVKGSDPGLRELARRDLAGPKGQEAYNLANAWWDWAEAQADATWKSGGQARAASRYRAALPELRGLPRTVAERRLKAAPPPPGTPPEIPGGWVVIFRGDDPKAWNTAGRGNTLAIPLERVSNEIRFLRLKRLDTNESIVVPITKDALTRNGARPEDTGYFRWNGENGLAWGAHHLGIAEGPVISGFDRSYGPGKVAVLALGIDFQVGSGFGHKAHERPEAQAYGWRGEPIARTAFEIAVTTGLAEATPTPSSPLPGLPPWRIVPGLAARPGAPRVIGAYEIRPPEGFTPVEALEDSTVRFYRGESPFPDRGSLPRLSVTLGKLDAIDQNRSVEHSSGAAKALLHRETPGYHEMPGELGTINGMVFLRNRFEGTQAGTNPPVAVKGVTYYAIDGPTWIRITALAEATDAARMLPPLEAAAGTFRRR